MPIPYGALREQLLAGDAEFQHLAQEHSRYDEQLEQLTKSPYLSSEDILLQANLKKMKLRIKDEMERRVAMLIRSGPLH